MQQPEIIKLSSFRLAGLHRTMTFASHQPAPLWQQFMPRRKELQNASNELYSCELYSPDFFEQFNPEKPFEKWACMLIAEDAVIPDGMDELPVKEGVWARFRFRGSAAQAPEFYRYIYSVWLPASGYQLDQRPHMAVMGEAYRRDDPASEEDILIPLLAP